MASEGTPTPPPHMACTNFQTLQNFGKIDINVFPCVFLFASNLVLRHLKVLNL